MMKTKKFLLAALAVMCAMTMTTVCTSCGDDDDSSSNTPKVDNKKPVAIALILSMPLTEDMQKYCDVEVKYNNGEGEKTETVTGANWEKTLLSALPATFTFSRTVRMKADVDTASLGTIHYNKGYASNAFLFNAVGDQLNQLDFKSAEKSIGGKGPKVAELINSGRIDFNDTYIFDENGNRKK